MQESAASCAWIKALRLATGTASGRAGFQRPARPAHFGEDEMTRWTTYHFDGTWRLLPRISAVYAIFADGRLLYIGQSEDLLVRFAHHNMRHTYANHGFRTPWGVFDSITLKYKISSKMGDWLMSEYRLIRRLKPPQNCIHGP